MWKISVSFSNFIDNIIQYNILKNIILHLFWENFIGLPIHHFIVLGSDL